MGRQAWRSEGRSVGRRAGDRLMRPLYTAGDRGYLERGVYRAPWRGVDGQTVLIAVTSAGALFGDGPVIVPHGTDPVATADELHGWLDEADPVGCSWTGEE